MPTQPIPLATHEPKSQRATITIPPADLLRSVYVIGKTGTGKTTLLEQLTVAAAGTGFGACLIDPHGDMSRRVLGLLPRRFANQVVHFRPAEETRPIGLNLLAPSPGIPRAIVASGVVEVFRKLWGRMLFGPRSEHLLRNAVLALLETPGTTLLSLLRLLTDEPYRLKIVARVTDPVVRLFWLREFPGYGKSFAAEVTAPLLNKLGALAAPAVRRVVGQVAPRLRLREVLDERRILIADLSGIGRDAAELLGALLVSGIATAAQSRAGTPIARRSPFLLVADEFHAYTTASFAQLLAEGRKFGLCAALAHQYLDQLEPEIRAAILGNVGTMIAFRVSAADAAVLAPEVEPELTVRNLVRLKRHHIVMRLLRHGEPEIPTTARTIPPGSLDPLARARLERLSRERYGRPVELVDREIAEALGMQLGALTEPTRKPAPPRRRFR